MATRKKRLCHSPVVSMQHTSVKSALQKRENRLNETATNTSHEWQRTCHKKMKNHSHKVGKKWKSVTVNEFSPVGFCLDCTFRNVRVPPYCLTWHKSSWCRRDATLPHRLFFRFETRSFSVALFICIRIQFSQLNDFSCILNFFSPFTRSNICTSSIRLLFSVGVSCISNWKE